MGGTGAKVIVEAAHWLRVCSAGDGPLRNDLGSGKGNGGGSSVCGFAGSSAGPSVCGWLDDGGGVAGVVGFALSSLTTTSAAGGVRNKSFCSSRACSRTSGEKFCEPTPLRTKYKLFFRFPI